jgi:hypothetical protein
MFTGTLVEQKPVYYICFHMKICKDKLTNKNILVPDEIPVQTGIPVPLFWFFSPEPEFPDPIPVPA